MISTSQENRGDWDFASDSQEDITNGSRLGSVQAGVYKPSMRLISPERDSGLSGIPRPLTRPKIHLSVIVLNAMTVALRVKSPMRPSVERASKMGYGYLEESAGLTDKRTQVVHPPSVHSKTLLNPIPVTESNSARYC